MVKKQIEEYEQFFQKKLFPRKLTDRSLPEAAPNIGKKFSTFLPFVDSNYWFNFFVYGMN